MRESSIAARYDLISTYHLETNTMKHQSALAPRDNVTNLELVDEINQRLTQARTLAIVLRDEGFDGLSDDVRINTAWAIQTLTEDCRVLVDKLWQNARPVVTDQNHESAVPDLDHGDRPRGLAA